MSAVMHQGAASAVPAFNPRLWLDALTSIGGGYALGSDKRLFLLVDACPADELTGVMAQIVGNADRQDAVRHAITQHQIGEA